MTELKLEIGDNLKEVMLALINMQSINENRPSLLLYEAFGIDFGKILKGFGKKIQVISREKEYEQGS